MSFYLESLKNGIMPKKIKTTTQIKKTIVLDLGVKIVLLYDGLDPNNNEISNIVEATLFDRLTNYKLYDEELEFLKSIGII